MDADLLKAIERDWKDNSLSVTLIRIKHGLADDNAVLALAQRHGWGARKSIQSKIKDGTLQEMVNQHAAAKQDGPTLVDEDEQMSLYTQHVAGVLRSHHQGLGDGRQLADQMLQELKDIQPPAIDQDAIDSLAALVETDNPQLAEHLRAHIGPVNPQDKLKFLGRRIGLLNTLSQTQVNYINAERKSYGLDEQANTDGLQFDDVVDGARKRVEARQ